MIDAPMLSTDIDPNQTPEPEGNFVDSRIILTTLGKLGKDLKKAAATLTELEARYLVDTYYRMQGYRIRAASQIRAIEQGADEGGTHQVLSFFQSNFEILETQMKGALGVFAGARPEGAWLQAVVGIGPVISAGLIANIDIAKAKYSGSLWKYAGIASPTADKWEKGQKRPYNASLKLLLVYKAGESFVKFQNNKNDVYGKLFAKRKQEYIQKNQQGAFASAAQQVLRDKNIGKTTDAYIWYSGSLLPEVLTGYAGMSTEEQKKQIAKYRVAPGEGTPMLPPAHIHARARRFAVKIFASHLHEVMFFKRYGVLAPLPYIIDVMGHSDYIPVPYLEAYPDLLKAYEAEPFHKRARIIDRIDHQDKTGRYAIRDHNGRERLEDTPLDAEELGPIEDYEDDTPATFTPAAMSSLLRGPIDDYEDDTPAEE